MEFTGTLVWFDVETTGLDPTSDALLQVGIKVAPAPGVLGFSYEEDILWHPELMAVYRGHADPVVEAMHSKTGLWDACTRAGAPIAGPGPQLNALDDRLVGLVRDLPKPLYLAGNSIHFDRRWAIECLPKFDAQLHHRMLDVSALNVAGELFGFPRRPKPAEPAHTTLADIEDSIANLEYWRGLFRLGLGAPARPPVDKHETGG